MSEGVYAHGLPFSEKAGENIVSLRRRVEGRKASLCIIDGGVGEGKTTLAVHVAEHYQGEPLDYTYQYAMGGSDFLKKLRTCYEAKKTVVIYDEAGDFNKRGALSRFNAMLNRTFETFRAFNILVIIVLPSFRVLDNSLFDKNIPRLLLHTEARTARQGNIKGYSLFRMLYLRERMKKLVVPSFAYGLVQPNFYAHFLDLPKKRSRELDRISTAGKIGQLEAAEIKIDGLVSYRDISTKLARSVVWVRKKVAAMGIKEARTIKQRKYFEEGIIDVIADRMDDDAGKEENRR